MMKRALFLVLVAVAGACGGSSENSGARESEDKSSTPGAMASLSSCEAYMQHVFELGSAARGRSEAERARLAGLIKDAQAAAARQCHQRMTAKQVECALAAKDIETATACEPEFDPRPTSERPEAGECARLGSHISDLVLQNKVQHVMAIDRHQRERDALVADPDAEQSALDLSERLERIDDKLANQRKSLASLTEVAASMGTTAKRECRRGTPRSEVLCSLAAKSMREHADCGPR